MSGKFIGTIAAAAVALTAFGAAPAFADKYDTERAIGALLGIAIVGKIIHDKKKREDRAATHTRPRTESRVKTRTYGPRDRTRPDRHRDRVEPRPLPRRVNKRLLPRNCFRSFETRRGTYRGFGAGCLNKHYRHASSLPHNCLVRIRTDRGPRRAFGARCLRNAGYRLARG